MNTKVIYAELTYKQPRTDPDYPAEVSTFYGEDARDKALNASRGHTGYLMTIRTVEKIL